MGSTVHTPDPNHPGYDAIHEMFGLSYANYIVLNRSMLQSMPEGWQERFVQCINELDSAFEGTERARSFRVSTLDENGKFTKDPIPHYNRGRVRLPIHNK